MKYFHCVRERNICWHSFFRDLHISMFSNNIDLIGIQHTEILSMKHFFFIYCNFSDFVNSEDLFYISQKYSWNRECNFRDYPYVTDKLIFLLILLVYKKFTLSSTNFYRTNRFYWINLIFHWIHWTFNSKLLRKYRMKRT